MILTMKRLVYAIALGATMFFASSCEETIFEMDGDWDPIELDKTHVNFPPEGGQNTVSALNYSRWWINGGYEIIRIADQKIDSDYIHATSSDGEDACTYDILDGGWYHVTVPDKGKSNTIIITVDPLGDDRLPREAIIKMQAGDAFTQISICQQ